MTDRRLFPANARVVLRTAAAEAPGRTPVDGARHSITAPLADLLSGPDGARDRQLVFGDDFLTLEVHDGWAFGVSAKDGYVGYVDARRLGPPFDATHFVAVPATHAYAAPDVKAPDLRAMSFGSRVRIVAETHKHFETSDGTHIPKPHLRPLAQPFRDPVTVAQMLFGVPYLWGGNSVWGIDCSGLVQIACLAAGIDCPGDSDMQATDLGDEIAMDAPYQRGDLIFWKGHVGFAVDSETLLHANAHHMAVAYEPIMAAIARIDAQEGMRPVLRRRL